jgi:hypothetical protein
MDMTILPKRGGGFVFDGSDTGFPWNLGYPSYHGLDAPKWIGMHAYPHRSRANHAIQRLVANLISAAELDHPRRTARAASHRTSPLRILSPIAGQPVPVGMPSVVVWTGGPSTMRRVKVMLDGRTLGTKAAWRSTFTGRRLASAGSHLFGVTALDASGRPLVSTSVRVMGVPASSSIFDTQRGLTSAWSPLWNARGPLWRAWA